MSQVFPNAAYLRQLCIHTERIINDVKRAIQNKPDHPKWEVVLAFEEVLGGVNEVFAQIAVAEEIKADNFITEDIVAVLSNCENEIHLIARIMQSSFSELSDDAIKSADQVILYTFQLVINKVYETACSEKKQG